jgi:hypothetical protein
MIDMDFKAVKQQFFDNARVMRAIDGATSRVLSRFGAFVRTRAQTSMRKRKKPAPPGRPPAAHTGLLRRFLFFAYDPARRSVVVGPIKLTGIKVPDTPATLEYGGGRTVMRPVPGARSGRPATGRQRESFLRLVKAGRIASRPRQLVSVQVRVEPRPYMGPALQAELPGLPALWRDSVR